MIIELEREDSTVMLDVTYQPACPGVHTLRNGDPGYPDEPEDFDINSMDPEIEITEAEASEILEIAAAKYYEQMEYDADRMHDVIEDDKYWKR